ncbi:extracellular solute-binding protein [Desulfovibrio inopinatus]|uniref:extracellular solute-binding protein n=1 Tax=Desulfovibrio inopinatus TaxID=102109 RepID=UPI000553CCDF|nr:extracellular solute-binding protein [Desulfovibrio inopinatus]
MKALYCKNSLPILQTIFFILLGVACLFVVRARAEKQQVVVYTSVDQVYAEPVLRKFERESGIEVLPIYDVEAAKTTGLVMRLIAEKGRPRADVFWSGEFSHTLLLQEKGVLQPYASPLARDIPAQFRDPQGFWTGFAGRARVLIVNTDLVSEDNFPDSVDDLLSPNYPGEMLGMAYPIFGTSATHAAALYALHGPQQARQWFEDVRGRGVRMVDGNSVIRDLVVQGRLQWGITDTDDACVAMKKGASVKVVFPDQDDTGTLVITNTVALIKGAPHPEQGRKLIDYLVSPETEAELVRLGWSHIPLREIAQPSECYGHLDVKPMHVDYRKVFENLESAKEDLARMFIR